MVLGTKGFMLLWWIFSVKFPSQNLPWYHRNPVANWYCCLPVPDMFRECGKSMFLFFFFVKCEQTCIAGLNFKALLYGHIYLQGRWQNKAFKWVAMNRAKTPVPWKERGTGTRYGEHSRCALDHKCGWGSLVHSVWLQSECWRVLL